MLYRQIFKTLTGAEKRCRFERAHASDRGNVNYRFFPVRCRNDGQPDKEPYKAGYPYWYRVEKTLRDYPSDPRTL